MKEAFNKYSIYCAFFLLFIIFGVHLSAQNKGNLSASLESNTAVYMKDSLAGSQFPEDRFGSNNYLKVDYQYSHLKAGIQFESYLPALQGHPIELNKSKLAFKYASFDYQGLQATAGDFYEQWGSGLLFRAWENRALGLNTSVEGIRLAYDYKGFFRIKTMYGRPRRYMNYASSWLRGADLSLSISSLSGWETTLWEVEGSFLNKYEAVEDQALYDLGVTNNVNSFSFRTNFSTPSLSIKAESVFKQKDAAIYNSFSDKSGKAFLAELSYYASGFSILATFRSLSHMESHSIRNTQDLSDQINYIPSLTQQHGYFLASCNPYQSQGFDEIGGQLDAFYSPKRGKTFHLNFSTFYGHKPYSPDEARTLLYREICMDYESKWNSKLKTTFLYTWQAFNPMIHGGMSEIWNSHIAVADIEYRFNRKHAIRTELQCNLTPDDLKSWVGARAEYQSSSHWTFGICDWWNYGGDNTHYYSADMSYSRSKIRASLGLGRFMGGYQCSGGVCRMIPTYTGLNFSLTVTY